MKVDWIYDENAPRCRVIDLVSGKQLVYCAEADEETGRYKQWAYDEASRQFYVRGPLKNEVFLVDGQSTIRIEAINPDDPYLDPNRSYAYAKPTKI